MWNALHRFTILPPFLCGLVAATILGSGCATPLEVSFDADDDFSPSRTWSWARESGASVEAPEGEAASLEARTRRYIERALAAKGFRRVRSGSDFVVGYRLSVARRSVVENQARASYELSSLTSSGSYLVEGSAAEKREYQATHLVIGARRASGEGHWRAELRQYGEAVFSLTARQAVARLLERFPDPAPRAECGEPSVQDASGELESDARCAPPEEPAPSPHPGSRHYEAEQLG